MPQNKAFPENRVCAECGRTDNILNGIRVSGGSGADGEEQLLPICAVCFVYLVREDRPYDPEKDIN